MDHKTLLKYIDSKIHSEELRKQILENDDLKKAFIDAMEKHEQYLVAWLKFTDKIDKFNNWGLNRGLYND